ncbi:MAG: hypothetical protein KJ900_05540 [Proteobacteria bacterium]|nr:hypothetical protein [Desulfocapsa sp.]MBU3944903.1 hypothetical protein [Pseudomonadota bacterium]MBU4411537.1 hypothetical protein [Actinomycetota bacterium]MCG2744938.1 hypothetical protein [Desulfobacteraceae bacterium]MBU4027549.1 hypothetical protein [Pseudomonadota bacterium]
MKQSEYTTCSLPSSRYYILDNVSTLPQPVTKHGNLISSCSHTDGVLSVFLNDNLVFSDTVSRFTSKVSFEFERILNVLTTAIRSLKLTQDYNGTYIAYLSGQLSDEDFLNEATHYAYSPLKKLDLETIKDIKILFEATKIEFTSSDIAEIFKIEHDLSVDAIRQLDIPSIREIK